MRFSRSLVTGLLAAAVAGTVAIAASHSTPEGKAIEARQSHMKLYAFNLGTLGAMAKGEMEFDAEAAQAAASNLAALSTLAQRPYWVPGTSTDEVENTRALPAIWKEGSDVREKATALAEAAAAMAANAGTLDGVRANMNALGGACGACHKAYRQPE